MNLISLIGLFSLLLCAVLLSSHKRQIRIRPIAWGISLQVLFALIILRKDWISFGAMGLLALLIVLYQSRPWWTKNRKRLYILIPSSMALTGTVVLIKPVLPWLITLLILIIITQSFIKKKSLIPGVLTTITIYGYLLVNKLSGKNLFSLLSEKIASFLNLSDYGANFLFGNLTKSQYFFTEAGSAWPGFGFQFAFKVLPTIIFFGGFMGVLYHLGIMQRLILIISRFMRWTIGTSGPETLSCSANMFVGQTEAPLLIRPYLSNMTQSELGTVMVGGFATIAGGVLAGYIAMGIPAGHLIAASVMSAPAALAIGKIIFPETEKPIIKDDELPEIKTGSNILESATNGISDGLKLAINVGAMLLGFIALVAVLDLGLNWLDSLIDGKFLNGEYIQYASASLSPAKGEFLGIFPGSLQKLFGTLLKPLAFLMGVPWQDAGLVGNLLGTKLSLNEFVAYGTLGSYIQEGAITTRSITIATYALCGFANFSSIGIQLGGISSLAPNRKSDLAKVAFKAMLGGAIASWITATIAGIFV